MDFYNCLNFYGGHICSKMTFFKASKWMFTIGLFLMVDN